MEKEPELGARDTARGRTKFLRLIGKREARVRDKRMRFKIFFFSPSLSPAYSGRWSWSFLFPKFSGSHCGPYYERATTDGRRPLTSARSSHYPVKYPFLFARTGMTRKIDRCPFLFALRRCGPSATASHRTEISRRRLLRNPFRGDRKMIEIAVRWNLVDLWDLQPRRTLRFHWYTSRSIQHCLSSSHISWGGRERIQPREYCRP